MSDVKGYGVVYTPEYIADFLVYLLKQEMQKDNYVANSFLDPACGEGALLISAVKEFGASNTYIGIDVEEHAIARLSGSKVAKFRLYCEDAILPKSGKEATSVFWKKQLPNLSVVLANPPWSSEKIYSKEQLTNAGFEFHSGQYDSYGLFLELAYRMLADGGYLAFIVPDSLFENQNTPLRKFLCEKTHIRVIARLGEKMFPNVNRAATVLVCKKSVPNENCETTCFRLTSEQRKLVLAEKSELPAVYEAEKHCVRQLRFTRNDKYLFDIDIRSEEENLIQKLCAEQIEWRDTFKFGRGVEISKKGTLVICPYCKQSQGYTKTQLQLGVKMCVHCGQAVEMSGESLIRIISETQPNDEYAPIYVGENIRRYTIQGESYIKLGVAGVNYKDQDIYQSPKLLIRKTGLGIYACIDYAHTLTSQTVYILQYHDEQGSAPLEYYLALLNSRVIFYFYLKVYGENEWKSHPYLTKEIIFSLPLKKYTGDLIDKEIARLSKQLSQNYDYATDLRLESLVFQRYGIMREEANIIRDEINKLPDLSSINDMKFTGGSADNV